LYWSTASEQNNDFFSVERSEDGITFHEIGTVKGAGNSATVRYYEFADTELPSAAATAILYYRLKQTDFDGNYSYSDILAIELLPPEEISVHSNWTNEQLLIFFPESFEGTTCTVRIFDMGGRVLSSNHFIPHRNKKHMWINASGLSPGVYIIAVETGGKSCFKKFVRQ
jgi:hypothetical protein